MVNALTTSFVPPSSCFDAPWTQATTQTGGPILFRENNDACQPNSGAAAYSPGICPVGFSTASASVSGSKTYGFCCPSGYAAGGDSLCASKCSATTTIDCLYTAGVSGACNPGTIPSGAVFFQNNIVVVYQQTDLTMFPSGYTPGPVANSQMPRITMAVTSHHSGPSKGAIAGIAVGLVVLILLQVGVLYYLCVVRRKSKARQAMAESQGENDVEATKAAAKAKELELELDEE